MSIRGEEKRNNGSGDAQPRWSGAVGAGPGGLLVAALAMWVTICVGCGGPDCTGDSCPPDPATVDATLGISVDLPTTKCPQTSTLVSLGEVPSGLSVKKVLVVYLCTGSQASIAAASGIALSAEAKAAGLSVKAFSEYTSATSNKPATFPYILGSGAGMYRKLYLEVTYSAGNPSGPISLSKAITVWTAAQQKAGRGTPATADIAACAADTCALKGYCGRVDEKNVCGSAFGDCGACSAGKACNQVTHTCQCAPSNSVRQARLGGLECGDAGDDGCGGRVLLGECLADLTCTANKCTGLPVLVPPPIDDLTVRTDPVEASKFLYQGTDGKGTNAVQKGVEVTKLDEKRLGVIRGCVTGEGSTPLPGVRVTILDAAYAGYTFTREDDHSPTGALLGRGCFDLVVNGNGLAGRVVVDFQKPGYVRQQRWVELPWREIRNIEPLQMTLLEEPVASLSSTTLAGGAFTVVSTKPAYQNHTGTPDTKPTQISVAFQPGTKLLFGDAPAPADKPLTIRITPLSFDQDFLRRYLPLPATVRPTMLFDVTIDEAGDKTVQFTDASGQPGVALMYVTNFLGLPPGVAVPLGTYDYAGGRWQAWEDSLVLRVEKNGASGCNFFVKCTDANNDHTCDAPVAASDDELAKLGITPTERDLLCRSYSGQDYAQGLWRLKARHFSPVDPNLYSACRAADCPAPPSPDGPNPNGPDGDSPCNPDPKSNGNDGSECGASEIRVESQTLLEDVAVEKTPFRLHYSSSRVPGRKGEYRYTVKLPKEQPGDTPDKVCLSWIEVGFEVAGAKKRWACLFPRSPGVHCTTGGVFFTGPDPYCGDEVTFNWDGKDANGREVQGIQPLRVTVAYAYGTDWTAADLWASTSSSYGDSGGGNVMVLYVGTGRRMPVIRRTRWRTRIGAFDARPLGLGGWTLSNHHVFDPFSQTLYRGDGISQRVEGRQSIIDHILHKSGPLGWLAADGTGKLFYAELYGRSVSVIRRNGTGYAEEQLTGLPGETGEWFSGIAVTKDGSLLYLASVNGCVYRVPLDSAGRVTPSSTVVAGNCTGVPCSLSDNAGKTKATEACFMRPSRLAVDASGNLYVPVTGIVRPATAAIYKVKPDGSFSTVYSTEGGEDGIASVAADAADNIYFLPTSSGYPAKIKKLSSTGELTTLVGRNNQPVGDPCLRDGIPATSACLASDGNTGPQLAAGPDGSLFFPESHSYNGNSHFRWRRIGPDGIVSTVAGHAGPGTECCGAGPGTQEPQLTESWAACGYGGPAVAARLCGNQGGVAVDAEGNLLVSGTGVQIVRPASAGTVGTILVPNSDGSEFYEFSAVGQHQKTRHGATGQILWSFDYDNDGRLTTATDAYQNVTTIEHGDAQTVKIAGYSGTTTLRLNREGLVTAVRDPAGNETSMTYAAGGLLEDVTNRDDFTGTHAYDPNDGKLIHSNDGQNTLIDIASKETCPKCDCDRTADSQCKATGCCYYDPATHALTTSKPGSGVLVRAERTTTVQRGGATAPLTVRTVQHAVLADDTLFTKDVGANGATTTTHSNTDGSRDIFKPNGERVALTVSPSPDRRWGMLVPYPSKIVHEFPQGPTRYTAAAETATVSGTPPGQYLTSSCRKVQIGSAYAPPAMTSCSANALGMTATSFSYDPVKATGIYASQVYGYAPSTLVINAFGAPVAQTSPGLARTTFDLDGQGRLVRVTTGDSPRSRTTSMTYEDPTWNLSTVTSGDLVTTFANHDSNGRPQSLILPGNRRSQLEYTAEGQLSRITPPEKDAHVLGYTGWGAIASYLPPAPSDGASNSDYLIEHRYDGARRLAKVLLGSSSQAVLVEAAYLPLMDFLASITLANNGNPETITFEGEMLGGAPTGAVKKIATSAGQTLTYQRAGDLITSVTSGGPVKGSIGYTYHLSGALAGALETETVTGADPAPWLRAKYLWSSPGPRSTTVQLSADSGALGEVTVTTADSLVSPVSTTASVTMGGQSITVVSNELGEAKSYTATHAGGPYQATYDSDAGTDYRDRLGRLKLKVETVGGAATSKWTYDYDEAGWLKCARLESAAAGDTAFAYGYDSNGNRTAAATVTGQDAACPASPEQVGQYDKQDRLTQYRSVAYGYDYRGRLKSKGGEWAYTYDDLGNLTQATKTNGSTTEVSVAYTIDGQSRRVERRRTAGGTTMTTRFLYADRLRPIAELDGDNKLVAYYLYAGQGNAPDVMVRQSGGTWEKHLFVKDQVGSIRKLIRSDGQVVQDVEYGPFGEIISDGGLCSTWMHPFGFAGGIYDCDTGLLRFGVRDYDPEVGRWIGRDPILFKGGDTNLYAYVGGDPINRIDPSGFTDEKEKSWARRAWEWIADVVTGWAQVHYVGPAKSAAALATAGGNAAISAREVRELVAQRNQLNDMFLDSFLSDKNNYEWQQRTLDHIRELDQLITRSRLQAWGDFVKVADELAKLHPGYDFLKKIDEGRALLKDPCRR